MPKLISILSLLLISVNPLFAQKDTLHYDVSLMTLTSSGKYAPFWQQSIRYGSVLSSPNSSDLFAGVYKELGNSSAVLKYGYKATLLFQTDYQQSHLYFHELYVHGRLSVLDIIFGKREQYLGCQDSVLSCGGILFSKNARPMPKITLGIENFAPLPFTFGYLEAKGAMSHGWFTDNIYMKNSYLQHLYAYLRIGGRLPIHISYGLDDVVEWGGYNAAQGQQPDKWSDFWRLFFGKNGGKDALITDQTNALGNHIISQSLKLEVDVADFKLSGYWQNISEDGPIRLIGKTMNAPDGLWGVTLRNNKFPFLKGILYEYLQTTDQSGPFNEKDGISYGGQDDYFNNGVYQNGWNYYLRTIGTPFISSPTYNSDGTIYTLNNRVQVHHFGAEGDIYGYRYLLFASFSKNYGTYNASFPAMIRNTSLLLELNKRFPRFYNIDAGCSIAADFGKLYGNSVSCMFTIRKTGILCRY